MKKVRKFFLDAEFIEDGKTIDLLSLGIVTDKGKEFYVINRECKLHLASDWVREKVLPNLEPFNAEVNDEMQQYTHYKNNLWMSRDRIKSLLDIWIQNQCGYCFEFEPQFWSYYADYDWVVFCQIFGKMIDLPTNYPKYCMDIKQLAEEVEGDTNNVRPRLPKNEHNALADARWGRAYHEALRKLQKEQFEKKCQRKLRSLSRS